MNVKAAYAVDAGRPKAQCLQDLKGKGKKGRQFSYHKAVQVKRHVHLGRVPIQDKHKFGLICHLDGIENVMAPLQDRGNYLH